MPKRFQRKCGVRFEGEQPPHSLNSCMLINVLHMIRLYAVCKTENSHFSTTMPPTVHTQRFSFVHLILTRSKRKPSQYFCFESLSFLSLSLSFYLYVERERERALSIFAFLYHCSHRSFDMYGGYYKAFACDFAFMKHNKSIFIQEDVRMTRISGSVLLL